jgi:hypothetical protein
MFAAIILNLQDSAQPALAPTQPQKFELGGGGGPSVPMYDVVDYARVLDSFIEVPSEHPVARAVRRARHLGEGLARARQVRHAEERAMAMGMLYGAALERTIQADIAHDLARRVDTKAQISVRARATGGQTAPAMGVIAVFLLGAGAAIALSKTAKR